MQRKTVILLLCGWISVFGQPTPSISEVTTQMQRRYDMIDNLVARFSQQVKFGYSNIEQQFSGTLTMKKPNHYRVESEHQILVTDGATVWAYSPVNKQVVIDSYKENENSISPNRFLINLPENYYATVLGTEKDNKVNQIVLKLVPKDDRSFVKSVKLWVDQENWTVRKIHVSDINETETSYSIDKLIINTSVKDTLFSFSPPPGTEVVDLR